jgi:hypothetical protein
VVLILPKEVRGGDHAYKPCLDLVFDVLPNQLGIFRDQGADMRARSHCCFDDFWGPVGTTVGRAPIVTELLKLKE